MTTTVSKRKPEDSLNDHHTKRAKVGNPDNFKSVPTDRDNTAETSQTATDQVAGGSPRKTQKKQKVNKLVPPRPFPTVPTSVSATGPRSAHVEGKNYICITRKTPLGAYLRRCKEVVMDAGYKTLHLHAMGAAIPHLLTLAASIPAALPFAPDEINTEVLTGTVEVVDEIISDDDEQDASFKVRGKSTISVVIRIGDGIDHDRPSKNLKGDTKTSGSRRKRQVGPDALILEEPEQDEQYMA